MSYAIDDLSIWRAVHSCFVDAVVDQYPDNRDGIVALLGGITFDAFQRGMRDRLVLAQPIPGREGEPAVGLQILADNGYVQLARIPAQMVGLDPASLAAAIEDMLDETVERLLDPGDGPPRDE